MLLVPVGQHPVGGLRQFGVGLGQRGVDHRQFMRIGADRLDLAVHGDQAVGGAGEGRAQPFLQGLHAPVLPQKGMPPPGAEIGDLQPVDPAQPLHLLPQLGHRAGVKHLQFEPAEAVQHGAAAQFHQHGQGGDFPHHDLGPLALEGQFILPVALFEVIGRQLQLLEPFHEIGAEHLTFAVEGVAAQEGGFAPAQPQGADVVELFAQLALVHQVRQPDRGRAVDQAEGHVGVRPVAEDGLAHQQLVEIRVDQGPHDRVDLPLVVIDAGGDIDHLRAPSRCRRPASWPWHPPATRSGRWRGRPLPAARHRSPGARRRARNRPRRNRWRGRPASDG